MFFAFIVIGVLALIFFQLNGKADSNEKIMKRFGNWDMPPVFNGNPYAPGSFSTLNDYFYGKFAIYKPLEDKYDNYLAESFEEDGNKLTIKLRKDFYWSDGTPVSSKDIYTQYMISGGLGIFDHIWKYMDSIETPDDYTVIFNLTDEASNLTMKHILTEQLRVPYHIYSKYIPESRKLLEIKKEYWAIDDGELGDDYTDLYNEVRENIFSFKPELPIGFGPYKLVKITSSDAVLEKNEKFPGIDNTDLEKIYVAKGNNEMRWSLLKTGEVDIIEGETPRDVVDNILDSNPGLKMIQAPSFYTTALIINNKVYPYSDKRFRQALAYIIDRETVRELAFPFGTTMDYISGVFPSVRNNWISTESLNPYNQNWDKAAELLEDMGMKKNSKGFWCDKNGEELDLTIMAVGGYTSFIIASDEISRQLIRFGLNTKVSIKEFSLVCDLTDHGKHEMFIELCFMSKLHPGQGFDRIYTEVWGKNKIGMDINVVGSDGGKIDVSELAENLILEKDKEKQKEMLSELAWITNEYVPVIDLVEKNSQFFILDGKRLESWPDDEELKNSLSANMELYPQLWLIQGKLDTVG